MFYPLLTVVCDSSLHALSLHFHRLSSSAGIDDRPRQCGGVHVALVAGLAEGRHALRLLHAQNEWPGSVRGVAGADGLEIAGKLVLSAHFQNITLALANSELASERAVGVLLGVSVWHLYRLFYFQSLDFIFHYGIEFSLGKPILCLPISNQ